MPETKKALNYVPPSPSQILSIRLRLSPNPKEPITQEKMAEILGVKPTTVQDWENGRYSPRERNAEKIRRLVMILDCLGNLIKREHRMKFLMTNHPLLYNQRPIDLLDSDEGLSRIIKQITGAKTGSFA